MNNHPDEASPDYIASCLSRMAADLNVSAADRRPLEEVIATVAGLGLNPAWMKFDVMAVEHLVEIANEDLPVRKCGGAEWL